MHKLKTFIVVILGTLLIAGCAANAVLNEVTRDEANAFRSRVTNNPGFFVSDSADSAQDASWEKRKVSGTFDRFFALAGRERALTLGFTASQRNTGLMLAATAGALPDLSWLYFAFTYFPLYLLPLLLHPLARRITRRARTTPVAPR